VQALKLPQRYSSLNPEECQNLLLTDLSEKDPFENLYTLEAATIRLLIVDSIPRFGDSEWMDILGLKEDKYTLFRTGTREKFVLGDPIDLNDQIDYVLGYHKDFPYLPF